MSRRYREDRQVQPVDPGRPAGVDPGRPAGVDPGRSAGVDPALSAEVDLGRPAAALLALIGRARLVRSLDEATDLVEALGSLPGIEALALVPRGAAVPSIPPGSSAWPLGSGANASVLVVDVDRAAPTAVRKRVNAFATALDLALRRAPQRRADDRSGEDAAQRARALRAVLDSAPALVLVVRPDGTWTAETVATAQLADEAPADLATDGPPALLHPADRALAVRIFRAALAGQEQPDPVRLRVRTPGGGWASRQVVVRSLLDHPDVHGVVWYALEAAADPPVVPDPRADAPTSAAIPGDLAHAASHLVRTPLTAVISFADLLADEPDLPSRHRGLVRAVQRNADRLRILADDLLLLIRMESGTIQLRHTPLSVADLIGSVIAEQHPAARRAGVVVGSHVAGGPPLHADEVWLRRALGILLGRAVRVSQHGDEVTVATACDDAGWSIYVLDAGPGSEEDEAALSSGRLVRRPGRTDHPGFDLLIARVTVRRHGGWIRAHTTTERGTSVHVWLPRAADR